jgi:hypothetical protein
MQMQQLKELLLQSLEHERAGVEVYETAIRCAVSEDLKHQWSEYLEQTHTHAALLESVLRKLEIDPEHPSPGRRIVRSLGNALVMAMETAKASGDRMAAQLVACECIVLAETKDHMNWELLTKCAEHPRRRSRPSKRPGARRGTGGRAPHPAADTVASCGSTRSGCRATLPPPEEMHACDRDQRRLKRSGRAQPLNVRRELSAAARRLSPRPPPPPSATPPPRGLRALIGTTPRRSSAAGDDWPAYRARFPACFAALLGTRDNGRWIIAPTDAHESNCITPAPDPGDALLRRSGEALIDFMPLTDDETKVDVVRIVRGLRGSVDFEMELVLRFAYGTAVPWVQRRDYGLSAIAGPDAVELHTRAELEGRDLTTRARFSVREGDSVPFTLSYHPSHAQPHFVADTRESLNKTVTTWREWSKRCLFDSKHERWNDAASFGR